MCWNFLKNIYEAKHFQASPTFKVRSLKFEFSAFLGRQAENSIPTVALLKPMTLLLCASAYCLQRSFLHPLSELEVQVAYMW